MNSKENWKELSIIIISSIILALAVSFKNTTVLYAAIISFLIIIIINILTKKMIGYNFETVVKTKFWSWYQYGLRKDSHFKSPVPMAWLPLVIALFSKGFVFWLGILEFDVAAKAERASKRHGLYRFTQVTEWHMGLIATWAIVANLVFAIIGYILGFELFTKLSIYYAAWSIIPIAGMDGSKILFASKVLWILMAAIVALFLFVGLTIL